MRTDRAGWSVYGDASWDTALDKKMGCAKQGLYSKCFIDAVPCRPEPGGSQDSAKGEWFWAKGRVPGSR